MNHWSKSAYEINHLREKIERHEYIEGEAICTEYLADHAEEITDEVIGIHLLRAHCRAALGHHEDALNDHHTAVSLMEPELSGETLFDVAADAMNGGMPLDYCAKLFHRSAKMMESYEPATPPKLIAAAYNKEGICHFKSGGSIDDEIACFVLAQKIMDGIKDPDSDDLLLIALIQSNLAECRARSEDFTQAIDLYKASSLIYSSRRKKSAVCAEQYAMCQRNLSDIHRRQNENIAAHQCLSHAIDALEEHPDGATEQVMSQLASCLNARGTLRYNMGDYSGEVEDCTAALEFRRQISPDHFGQATVYANRAEAYEQLKEFDLAADDYIYAINELKLVINEVPLAGALIAMRYFSLGNVLCELQDTNGAIDAMTKSAEQFFAMRDIEFDVYSREQMREMESLCRLRLAQLAYDDRRCNYHISITEMRRAIALLEELEPDPMRMMRLASMHTAMGELYEIFDEYECAAEEYATAEMLRMSLGDSLADLAAQQEESVDDEDDIGADATGAIPQA